MNIISYIPIIPITLLAIYILVRLNRFFKIDLPNNKYHSIDGLRGYLALFVFFHHSLVWYFFLWTGRWTFPPSYLFNHMGPTSVGLFFMITSFLFVSKLADEKNGRIDWIKLYIGRILRIFSLYLLVCLIVFIIAFAKSGWKLVEPIDIVVMECLKWICFIQGDINGYSETRLIVARVVWSLAFEWMFYFSLPLWAVLFFRIKVSKITFCIAAILLFAFIVIIWKFYPSGSIRRSIPFLGGIVAVYISRRSWSKKIANSLYVSIGIALLLFITVYYYPDAYSVIPFLCMVIVFTAIAAGNTFFGILTHYSSRLLGQISYSIYLLHGISLFISLRCMPRVSQEIISNPVVYWSFLAIICVILIIFCAMSYVYIERPFIVDKFMIKKRIATYLIDDKAA